MKKGPLVGVAVFVTKNSKFLLGLRIGAHGEGTWALPGGKLGLGETVKECARRELYEETGLKIGKLSLVDITDDMFPHLHYITIILKGKWLSGKPAIKEPSKCREWRWVDWKSLPKPLFLPFNNLLKTHKKPF